MAVPTARTDLSTTASSNPPAGTDAIGTSHDDHMRVQYKFIRENYDDIQLKAPLASPSFTGAATWATPGSTNYSININVAANGNAVRVVDASIDSAWYHAASAAHFGTISNHPLKLRTNNTERLVIGSNGRSTLTVDGDPTTNVAALALIGAYGGGLKLSDQSGDIDAMIHAQSGVVAISTGAYGAGSLTGRMTVDNSGNVTAVDFVETSDRSAKENIEAAEEGALERIQALSIKEFEFKADQGRRKRVGVIADEVPSRYSVNGEAVSLTAIIFDLVKAVQELAAK